MDSFTNSKPRSDSPSLIKIERHGTLPTLLFLLRTFKCQPRPTGDLDPRFRNDPAGKDIASLSVHRLRSCLVFLIFFSTVSYHLLEYFRDPKSNKKIGMATSTLPHAVAQSYGLFRKESPPPGCKSLFRFFCVFICKIYSFSPSLVKNLPLRIHNSYYRSRSC